MRASRVLFSIAIAVLVVSCVSAPSTVDRGFHDPKGEGRDDWAVLRVDPAVKVESIDNVEVEWNYPPQKMRPQVVKLPSGSHTFSLTFDNGSSRSIFPQRIIALLAKDAEYKLVSVVSKNTVKFDVLDVASGESALLDLSALKGNAPSVLSVFIKYVLNPGMDEIKKTVKMENESMVLVFKPDMVYELTDKASGVVSSGRNGFIMDFGMKDGKVYLLETDIEKMSRQEFLDGDYQDAAQIHLIPTACSEKSVTFKYAKPEGMKDKEVTLSIEQID